MLEAVLFDLGHTLIDWVWDAEMLERGHRAGLRALGRTDLAEADAVVAQFRERYEPLMWAPGTIEEIEYAGLVRQLLADFDVDVTGDELEAYLEAEHDEWFPSWVMHSTTHALLEALRGRGLKLGLVSNAIDPPRLLHRDLERHGLAERLDFSVFSSEVGYRKPHPAIFERALTALALDPARTLFVGDRLYEDVHGASQLGMRTMQALWFRADEHPQGGEPDYRGFTQHDVLNVVRRVQR